MEELAPCDQFVLIISGIAAFKERIKAIIFQYRNFGVLNRSDAIEKYKKFNSDHPEYCAAMTAATTVSGTATSIDQVTNDVIVDNLCTQLLYLTGKNVWEEKNNGKSVFIHIFIHLKDF